MLTFPENTANKTCVHVCVRQMVRERARAREREGGGGERARAHAQIQIHYKNHQYTKSTEPVSKTQRNVCGGVPRERETKRCTRCSSISGTLATSDSPVVQKIFVFSIQKVSLKRR